MSNYNFKPAEVRAEIVSWIRNERDKNGLKGVVLGISGGKDSTVVAALCAEALGPENVLGVLMPNGVQKDIHDSQNVVKILGIKSVTVNIGSAFNELTNSINIGIIKESKRITNEASVNIAPRLRMNTLYTIAQSMGGGYRVCGTGNLSERTLGYFTKWGDGASDLNPIGNLTSIEVVSIGDTYTNIPYELIHKTPDDGLSGMSDEEKLGIKYIDVHNYLRNNLTEISKETHDKIIKMELASAHKRKDIPLFSPNISNIYN